MVTESDAAVVGDIDPVALATYKDGTGTRLSDYSLHGYKGSVISAADVTDTALGLVTKGTYLLLLLHAAAADDNDANKVVVVLLVGCNRVYLSPDRLLSSCTMHTPTAPYAFFCTIRLLYCTTLTTNCILNDVTRRGHDRLLCHRQDHPVAAVVAGKGRRRCNGKQEGA